MFMKVLMFPVGLRRPDREEPQHAQWGEMRLTVRSERTSSFVTPTLLRHSRDICISKYCQYRIVKSAAIGEATEHYGRIACGA